MSPAAQRSCAASLRITFADKSKMRLPYVVTPPSSLPTQLITGSSMVPSTVTLLAAPMPGPPVGA